MPTNTTNYGFNLPLVNNATDQDQWGGYLNANWTSIDSLLETATNRLHRFVSAADTATISDRNKIIIGDSTVASYAQTLPSAAAVGDGFTISCVKADATAHIITVTAGGADKIGTAATTYTLSAQNDPVTLISDGVSNWNFQSKSVTLNNATTSLAGIVQLATNAEVTTGTNSTKSVVPSSVSSHPGVAKAWVTFGSTGTIIKSYNVSSVTRNSLGDFTITFTAAMSDANYAISALTGNGLGLGAVRVSSTTVPSTTACRLEFLNNTGATFADPTRANVVFFD